MVAAARNLERGEMKMTSNFPVPSASRFSERGTHIAESQGSLSRVEVIVLRAHDLPRIKKQFGPKKRFYVTVTNHTTTKKTESVQVDGQTVHWNQELDAFYIPRSSHLILHLYEKRRIYADVLIGTQEIPVETQKEVRFVLTYDGRQAGQSAQPVTPRVTLYLTVVVSPVENAFHDANNALTTINLSNKWEGTLERIKWVMDTVSPVAELHPIAKMAHGLLSAIPKTLLEQFQRDYNIQTLLVAMHDGFSFANQEARFKAIRRDSRQAQILTLMLQHVCNCCDFIRSYAKDSRFWERMLKNAGGQADKKIEDFRATLLEQRKAFLDEATITTEITALQILDDVGIISANVGRISSRLDGMATQLKWMSSQVSDAELDRKIGEIPYGTGSRFTPDKGCLTGTRTAFLDFVVNWVNDPTSERCLILFGQAGTGKSSIAHEIARRFHKMHRLTSSFIFLRKEQSKREAYHLFTTLARDLSDRYPSFKAALGKVVKDNSSLRAGTRDYGTLFESLILEPLKDLRIVGPILVVIDALDESGDVTGEHGLHKFLAKAISKLPSNFRVLITSRPEHSIESAFTRVGDGLSGVKIKYMNDAELAATIHDDILALLQKRLPRDVFKIYGHELTKRAEGLFQWAAVACGYILNPPDVFGLSMIKCINHLLKFTADRRGQDPLDKLYKEVLEGYFTHENSRLLFRTILGQLIASIEPLSIRSLTILQQHASSSDGDSGHVIVALLRRLGSLLSNVNSSDDSLPIIPLHTSFRDFLTNKEKSGDIFCVSLYDAHRRLAHSCLNLLLKDLRFNICNLETSYLANKDVADISSRVNKYIPPTLLYACRFWGDHMEHIGFENDLFRRLQTFFGSKLLFWLEALSLTSNLGQASAGCTALMVWLASGQGQVSQAELEIFRAFVNDASVFIRYFGMAMAKSAPHIYLSALPFAPFLSHVSAHYSGSHPRILRVGHGQLSHWPSSEMVIRNVGGQVLSIAISPDGQRIVSGSRDGTIRVWNTTSGETEAGPFTGHMSSIESVAFSPDGQRIASGSDDRTIRVWNATTGELEAGPFTGHTSWVSSVAFSPDGQRVVSGSGDRTIRVWNATTGDTEAGPFTNHTSWVSSVAFSPNGQRIISGSHDKTIRVWNATTGETEAGPFTGHTSSVLSVAFSPDGHRIVSGSRDQTIRVWNTTTGETEAGPFTAHKSWVSSVRFSPDGQRIVSGSRDRSICVWNAISGEKEAGPFTGHTDFVWSVAFSPDGHRIVSSSGDGTIRVWNATSGETEADPFTAHTSSVESVAFSPDGQRIVSGSHDKTIRVWNATTGDAEVGPLTGHTRSVSSVAFSPDGQRIVSGSHDRTICVWNATSGEMEAGPFVGHTSPIESVAYSPDGQRIVSGSEDRTIRVWNATTGETKAGPFTGHTSSVLSVAFSPDGQRVISGSQDRTIRVWNATTGRTEADPFTAHTSSVESVAFSPDGRRIVSGSRDGTIRVWNATTGETEAGPFTGHTSSVESVAFSSDGRRIVSGSDDRTIRVWNATTGETEAGPYIGHTDFVWSVALSPDGQRMVSSSRDRTIRVWNTTSGERGAGSFTDHTNPISHAPFATNFPSYGPIVSVLGADDLTPRVLNATVGNTGRVGFTNHSVINEEGWICGSYGELLMWIPQTHRANLHRPSNIWVAGEYETRLNLSTFVHGQNWTTCINSYYPR